MKSHVKVCAAARDRLHMASIRLLSHIEDVQNAGTLQNVSCSPNEKEKMLEICIKKTSQH